MKRLILLLFVFCLLSCVCPLFSAEEKLGTASEELSELGEDLKTAGKAAAKGLSAALNSAGEAINKKAKSMSQKACIGSWQFKNAKAVTTLTFSEDGTFELQQKSGSQNMYWRGSYSATASSASCHLLLKGSGGLFSKTSDEIDETWTISFKVSDDSEMRLSSPDMPTDANGYDFSNLTLFVKQ